MTNQSTSTTKTPKSIFMLLCRLGGLWAAIFAPAIIIILALIIPFGDVMQRSFILKIITTTTGKIFLFLMISLPIWYGLDRILKILHHFNIYPKREKILTYGLALAWTVHAMYILFLR